MFDYVRLSDRSITERSIAFDWQNFFVSSIKFDYRTQSSDWVRLATPGIISYVLCVTIWVTFTISHDLKSDLSFAIVKYRRVFELTHKFCVYRINTWFVLKFLPFEMPGAPSR